MSDDQAWLEWRRGGITATDVADAANGTYGGEYGVVARKLGLITVEQNAAMERGHRWQPKVADAVDMLTGFYVVGEETWCQNAEDEMIRATVDGFLSTLAEATLDDVEGVLEVKTTGVGVTPNYARWGDQMQWQMLSTGLHHAVLAHAVIDDATDTFVSLRLTEVQADPFRQLTLVSIAERLWMHVQAGTLPDPDSASALDDVKLVHAVADPELETVDLSPVEDDVARLVKIKEAVKEVTDEQKLLEARIREAIGDATKGEGAGYLVTVAKPKQVVTAELEAQLLELRPDLGKTVLDKDRAKVEAKDLYEAHRAAVGARALTIKELA